ncbi:MAG TPA: Ig-like domain-containing protein, partial [Candidatus Rifleibacterium sp.]|nr:Ig-like domain-containing protein [Candidatus Rifleibacterium sp.]
MPAPAAKAPARNQSASIANPFAAQQAPAARPARVAQTPAMTNTRAATMSQPAAAPTQIVGLSPQNGSRVTNLTQPITIAFSEEVMPDTLNEFTFRLEDDFGPVPARIHYFKGNKQATLTPVGLLDSNKSYRIVVTQGITDAFGRPPRRGINAMFPPPTRAAAPAMPQYAAQPTQNPQREAAELEGFDADYQDPMAEMAQMRPAAAKPARTPAVSSPRNI